MQILPNRPLLPSLEPMDHINKWICKKANGQELAKFFNQVTKFKTTLDKSLILYTLWYTVLDKALDHLCSPKEKKKVLKLNIITEKNPSDKHKLKDNFQNAWPMFFQTVRIVKNKEILTNYHKLGETKRTWEVRIQSVIL